MKFTSISLAAVLSVVVSALTPADTSKAPEGNPIGEPGLNQQVPAGVPFHITWKPTTPGSVSILLLRGPSTNVVPIATIADSIPNTGDFVWTPSTDLENDVSHYGIQIIVEGTGQYQYSTQFGIKNDQKTTPKEPHQSPSSPSKKPDEGLPTTTLTLVSSASTTATQQSKAPAETPAANTSPASVPSHVVVPATSQVVVPAPDRSQGKGLPLSTGVAPAVPQEQPKYPPAPSITPAGSLDTVVQTPQPAPASASNFPVQPNSPLPIDISNSATSGVVAFGTLVTGALVALLF
ncbi:hypothetical protein KEM54_001445 [Ascosphaera aggregata]|nr:hypothetical protein KEM54_001445 [Ascosphaera aggregata]